MRKIILILVLITSQAHSQSVNYLNWSNPITFKAGHSPIIVGHGELSPSLYDIFETVFFVSGDEYFKIDTWASYYYWFTQKYFYLFRQPELYEYYYNTNNDFEMVRYIAKNYRGALLPSKIDFSSVNLKCQNMLYADNDIKANRLKNYINNEYDKEKEVEYLEKRKMIKLLDEKKKPIVKNKKERKVKVNKKSNFSKSTKKELPKKTTKMIPKKVN